MTHTGESVGHASELVRQRRLPEARAALGRLLSRAPDDAETLHLAGMVELMSARPAEALPFLRRCVEVAPRVSFAWSNLGVAYNGCGDFTNALACFRRSLALEPGVPTVLRNQGIALRRLGRHEEAMASLRSCAQRDPNDFEVHRELADLLADMGRFGEALARYDRSLAANPRDAVAHHNRGYAAWRAGERERAAQDYRRALDLDPGFARAWSSLGALLDEQGASGEAVGMHARAVELEPGNALFHNNLGVSLDKLGRGPEAIAAYDRALELQPDEATALQNRAAALNDAGRHDEALADYERAETLSPGSPDNAGHRLGLKLALCDWRGLDELVGGIVAGLAAGRPESQPFPLCQVDVPPAALRAASELHARRFAHVHASTPRLGARGGRIRVGYFSADFRDHPVGYLLVPLVECHDRARFEAIAFSFGPGSAGATRKRLEGAFDRFEDVHGLPDARIAGHARELGIDIAVDLMGYTRAARTAIFAHRAAPIQVQYLGFPGTMGVDFIDYLLADSIVVPEGHLPRYAEKIAFLPDTYQINDAGRAISPDAPGRAALGLPERGFVFCCFCNKAKIGAAAFDRWMRLLAAVDGSVLWLAGGSGTATANLRAEASRRGVDPGRLVFAPRVPIADHLARAAHADLFLDTYPYNGHATTSDSLLAGVPVVTWLGDGFAGRVSASLLNAVGLPELVATTPDGYEALALELARDPAALAAIRSRLRANRGTHALFDPRRFVRQLERLFERMVERCEAGLGPDHLRPG